MPPGRGLSRCGMWLASLGHDSYSASDSPGASTRTSTSGASSAA